MSTSVARTRLGASRSRIAGVLFTLYPAVWPWHDESTVDGTAQSMRRGNSVTQRLVQAAAGKRLRLAPGEQPPGDGREQR
jgi:hypothetical protein